MGCRFHSVSAVQSATSASCAALEWRAPLRRLVGTRGVDGGQKAPVAARRGVRGGCAGAAVAAAVRQWWQERRGCVLFSWLNQTLATM